MKLIPGKWYTTEDWLLEPSFVKVISSRTDDRETLVYHKECVLSSIHRYKSVTDFWASTYKFILVPDNILQKWLPEGHPDKIIPNIPNIKDIISNFLEK